MTRILAVDPHPIVQVGLQTILGSSPGLHLVGLAGDSATALRMCAEHQPDLVILEVNLPGESGVELCRSIKRDLPRTEVLVLTADDRQETALEAIRAGAAGYVLKDITPENLLRAVRGVLRGETVVHPRVGQRVVERLSSSDRDGGSPGGGDRLSEGEVAVLVEVARGATNKEIARKLFISESTVKSRLRNIFRKICVRGRAEAAAYAIRKGYLR